MRFDRVVTTAGCPAFLINDNEVAGFDAALLAVDDDSGSAEVPVDEPEFVAVERFVNDAKDVFNVGARPQPAQQ